MRKTKQGLCKLGLTALVTLSILLAHQLTAEPESIIAYVDSQGERIITIPNPEPPPLIGVPSRFGESVAVFKMGEAMIIVAGAPGGLVADVTAGIVNVIDGTTGDIIRTIENPAPAPGDQFGWAVAVTDGSIIVSAPRDDDPDGLGPIPSVTNAGSVFVFDRATGALLHTIWNPFPEIGDFFGEAIAVAPNGNIMVGAMRDDDPDGPGPIPQVRDTGSVFVFDSATGTLLLTIPSTNGAAWDWFGMNVAAIYDTILVSDPYYKVGGELGGAIRIFDGAAGNLLDTWSNPFPPPPGDGSWDQFGMRLVVDALRGEILNGACVDDDPDGPGPIPPVTNAGSAFIHDGATGTILHTIWNPFPGVGDVFGRAVAVAGGKYIIAARGDDDPDGSGPIPAVVNAGSVFVYDAETASLLHTIWNPFPETNDIFGSAVAAVESKIVIGAPQDDDPDGPGPIPEVNDAGSVFVYDANTGGCDLIIQSPGGLVPATQDQFGTAVAVTPERIIAGAPNDTLDPDGQGGAEAVVGAGSVYVLDKLGRLHLAIWNPFPGIGDSFGAAVAVDRYGHIIVGAPADADPDGPGPIPEVANAGSVFVFDGATGAHLHTILNPFPAAGDSFGGAVAVDQHGHIIVGAPSDDDPDGVGPIPEVTSAGSVFVFTGNGSLLYTIPNPAPGTPDSFGSSVAVDRHGNIIVGAVNDADPDGPDGPIPPAVEAGAAFVFDGTTGILLHTLVDPERDLLDQFGASATADQHGNILVGAPLKKIDGVEGGAVFLFDRKTGSLLRTFENPAPEIGDSFGGSIAFDQRGNIVIGAANDNDPDGSGPIPSVTGAGAVFLFDMKTGSLLRTFENPAPEIGDLFGSSVAVAYEDDEKRILIIGARLDDDPDGPGPIPEALNAGTVFIFR